MTKRCYQVNRGHADNDRNATANRPTAVIDIMSALHVNIIGAGLGGLCLAQGLRRAGISFDVFERDAAPAARFQGYRLRIDDNGVDALDRCLPPAQARGVREHAAVARTGGRFVTPSLENAEVVVPPSWHDSHIESDAVSPPPKPHVRSKARADDVHGDLSLHRQTLRELLLDGILDRVHFGKAFTHATSATADNLRVAHFEDGTCSAPGLIVAADGTHSRVREHLLPGMAPRDTGNVCFYGLTPVSTALLVLMDSHGEAALMEGSTVVFADGFAVVVDAMLFRRAPGNASLDTHRAVDARRRGPGDAARVPLSRVSDYLYWAFIGPAHTLLGRDGMSPDAAGLAPLARIDTLTRRWHPHLRSLFSHAVPDTVRTMPVRSTTCPIPWQLDGVTGLGDAVHTMSPAGGLGANTALSDAAMLAEQLQSVAGGTQSLSRAIAAYERDMCERAREAVRLADAGAAMLNARRAAAHETVHTAADAVHL
ncbi:FAD-dependent oxidoreductase [Pandoraea pneumonica]|uniref:FAD-dependent oxidoreductase n=1 Tax=Pandoraea pneumonica TaxID=2508299 RepID=UPI003CE98D9A